jgi:hypothetical protein
VGRGLVKVVDRGAARQIVSDMDISSQKTLHPGVYWRRSIMWTSAAKPCRSSGCDPPPACVSSRPAPMGGTSVVPHGSSVASELLPLAMLPGYPPPTSMWRVLSCVITLHMTITSTRCDIYTAVLSTDAVYLELHLPLLSSRTLYAVLYEYVPPCTYNTQN